MRYIHLFFCVLTFLSMVSCEKDIEFNIGDEKSMLILNSNIFADSTITCTINRSRLISEVNIATSITDAEVMLYENNALIGQFAHQKDSLYSFGEYKAKIGAEYKIVVSHDAYRDVEASVKLLPQIHFTIDNFTGHNQNPYGGQYNFEINMQDEPGVSNYYQLKIYTPSYKRIDNGNEQPTYVLEKYLSYDIYSTDPLLHYNEFVSDNDYNDYIQNSQKVFNDELFVDNNYKLQMENKNFYRNDVSNHFYVEVRQITRDTFLYYRSLDNYDYYGHDPFIEPIRIHTNVKNGAGVLIGTTCNRVRVNL